MYQVHFKSPVGTLRFTANDHALTSVEFIEEDATEDKAADSNEIINQAIAEIKEYFEGKRQKFDVPMEPNGTDFQKRVWNELVALPYGQTTSYLSLSTKLGDIKAIRAVAGANGQNPIGIMIPCHRVIGSDGSLTGYAGGLHRKEWLLQHEGAIAEQLSIF